MNESSISSNRLDTGVFRISMKAEMASVTRRDQHWNEEDGKRRSVDSIEKHNKTNLSTMIYEKNGWANQFAPRTWFVLVNSRHLEIFVNVNSRRSRRRSRENINAMNDTVKKIIFLRHESSVRQFFSKAKNGKSLVRTRFAIRSSNLIWLVFTCDKVSTNLFVVIVFHKQIQHAHLLREERRLNIVLTSSRCSCQHLQVKFSSSSSKKN